MLSKVFGFGKKKEAVEAPPSPLEAPGGEDGLFSFGGNVAYKKQKEHNAFSVE